ncbi:S1 RNA-binding domain-containing protein [Petrotoga olearia]|uniref:RNA-binding protein S1 n=2 Tax=Petrotoga olearia TaxID=156203 RepID=A0A2K1P008_9BACT|nr:S1 RNA-binding domain-containing protein [Petrotoga olearia]PNR96114.1 RNA-binding protein S1 [Petrotoga olearia DSM 13574]
MMEEKTFEKLLNEQEINEVKKGKVIEGKVFEINSDGIWVALEGATGDVFVSQGELIKPLQEYQEGQKILVEITKTNDAEGLNLASEKRALWSETLNKIKEGENYPIVFKNKLKKGYSVLIEGIVNAFLPGSLSLLRPKDDLPEGEKMAKVISKNGKNIVVSRRDYVEEKITQTLNEYNEGMVIDGVIEDIKNFGAFVKLTDHLNGLIPASEVSWDEKISIKDYLKVGQKVKAIIIQLDREKKRISLSLKRLKEDPWKSVDEKYPIGSIVQGTVTKILPFGFTVKLDEGIEGLVHETEVFWGRKGRLSDVVKVGDNVQVKILNIDKENKKINLSYKQVIGDPWETIEEKYKEGNIVTGTVEKVLNNGAIIKIDQGITGFLHVSELSWDFVDDISTVLQEKQKIQVKIIKIDKNNRKMRLSVRETKENPWKKASQEIKPGDTVKGKIIRFLDKGAIVLIDDYEIEAYLPASKASTNSKSLEETYTIGDQIEAKVLEIGLENEFKRGNMIISVSHLQEEREKEEAIKIINEMNED